MPKSENAQGKRVGWWHGGQNSKDLAFSAGARVAVKHTPHIPAAWGKQTRWQVSAQPVTRAAEVSTSNAPIREVGALVCSSVPGMLTNITEDSALMHFFRWLPLRQKGMSLHNYEELFEYFGDIS